MSCANKDELEVVESVVFDLERDLEKRMATIKEKLSEEYKEKVREALEPLTSQMETARVIAERCRVKLSGQEPLSFVAKGANSPARARKPARKRGSDKLSTPRVGGKQEDPIWSEAAAEVSYDEVSACELSEILVHLGSPRGAEQARKKIHNWIRAGVMRSTTRGSGRYVFTDAGRRKYGIVVPESEGNVRHLHRAANSG